MCRRGWIAVLIGCAGSALAHHGPAAEPLYDTGRVLEFDGVVSIFPDTATA